MFTQFGKERSRNEMRKQLSAYFGTSNRTIIVVYVYTVFGGGQARAGGLSDTVVLYCKMQDDKEG